MSHTPGPWKLDIEDDPYIYVEGANSDPVCEVYQNPEQRVNMHLIAAAPELLEALRDVQKWSVGGNELGQIPYPRSLVEKAIAKAEGKDD